MKISNIEIKNFKSFKDVSVNLNDFNVLVGQSASGKSNFIEVFEFLKDICDDFESGIFKHGKNFFQNINLNHACPSCIRISFKDDDPSLGIGVQNNENDEVIRWVYNTGIDYELCINFNNNDCDFFKETINYNYMIKDEQFNVISRNAICLINNCGEITAEFEKDEKYAELEFFVPNSLLNIVKNTFKENRGLIINSPLSSIPKPWASHFKSFMFYDLDPKFSKIDISTGSDVLSKFGENLSYVLERIVENDENKRKFMNLVSMLLPYVENVNVYDVADERKIFRLFESYSEKPILSPFISDGTTNVLALVSILYFGQGDVIFIEEPERHIHPSLLMDLVGMMKEVSSNQKQIIITTHSPEILNNCDLEDILFISRDENGFSELSKPIDSEDVRDFVKELGIGQIFIDGYLGFSNE